MRVMRGVLSLAVVVLAACADPVSPVNGGLTPTEGDWLPSVGGNATYVIQTGRWHREGNLVWVTGTLYIDQLGTGSSGEISGLPFESIDGQEPSGSVGYWANLNMNVNSLTITVRPNSKNLAFHASLGTDNRSPTVSPLRDGSLVYFSVSYEAKP